jgi:hypothetical protein
MIMKITVILLILWAIFLCLSWSSLLSDAFHRKRSVVTEIIVDIEFILTILLLIIFVLTSIIIPVFFS